MFRNLKNVCVFFTSFGVTVHLRFESVSLGYGSSSGFYKIMNYKRIRGGHPFILVMFTSELNFKIYIPRHRARC
jgi:hypothetical protein